MMPWQMAMVEQPLADSNERSSITAWSYRMENQMSELAWLIEWPEDDNIPTRWWNPSTGWMRDANKATWFCRKEDAQTTITAGRFNGGIIATEHMFNTEAASPSGAMEWRSDMGNAPRDGTVIDIWVEFLDYADRDSDKLTTIAAYRVSDVCWWDGAWRDEDGNDDERLSDRNYRVIAWMPLPAPPRLDQAGEGREHG